jgi:autotransporter-associated beta strand protein
MNSLNPLVLLAFALTANQLTPGSFAATSVWDGGGANALWATAGNWSNNTLPASGNDVLIGSAYGSGKTITLSGARYVNSVTFSNASGVTLVASTSLALGGHILHVATGDFTAKGSGLTTVDCRVNLASPGTFHIGYGRKLEFKRSLQGAPPPTDPFYFLYAGIHKTGDGELILGGTNTFGGVLFVEDGKLSVTTSNALPYTVLYVRGHPYDPTELHFGTGATPNINYLLLEGETVVTGGSNAKLYVGGIGLRDQADVDLVLAGSADVLVDDGAEAILRRNNTFTGDITFGYGSVLTVEHDPGLGSAGNTLSMTSTASPPPSARCWWTPTSKHSSRSAVSWAATSPAPERWSSRSRAAAPSPSTETTRRSRDAFSPTSIWRSRIPMPSVTRTASFSRRGRTSCSRSTSTRPARISKPPAVR